MLILLAACPAAGCVSSPGGEATRRIPTLVAVAPEDFSGDVPCLDAPGAMQSYVVRLFDHGTAEEPLAFELPASVILEGTSYRPVSCQQPAVFGHVVPGHKYSAIVEAYDRSDLVALAAGSPVLVDANGDYVAPRWTTRCGRTADGAPADGAVVSAFAVTRFVRGCEPLATTAPATETAISLSLTGLASPDECGNALEQIERFSVRQTSDPATVQEAPCGGSVVFSGLEPGAPYAFELTTFASGATTPNRGTTCFRVALQGATVPAACDPLSTVGTLEIDLGELLSSWGAGCGPGGDIQSITATLGDQMSTVACSTGALRFDELAPGAYSVGVTSSQFGDTPGPGAVCSGEVTPGLVARASCTPIPGT